MLVRRILEVSFFGFYWICVGLIALKFVYHKWLVQQLKIQKIIGDWLSCVIFILILFIIYIILRHCILILYAKCKLSEKRVIANLKKECRSLESGINSNVEAKNSTESLLSEPTFMSNEIRKHNYVKSMENLSTAKMTPLKIKAASLDNILKPTGTVNTTTNTKSGNMNYGNSVENLAGNLKSQDKMYADLSESLRHAILKRSATLGNAVESGIDDLDASVEDLLQIYENFYGMQNSMPRNKRPIRKAPPIPAHLTSNSHKNALASHTKNVYKTNSELKTVNEKCQENILW